MLVGVERLMMRVATHLRRVGVPAAGCHVVLPLSPNHGVFGGDGLYAESKAALMVANVVPAVVVHGRLGGSAITVAAINALACEREI